MKEMLNTPLPKAFDGSDGLCQAVDTVRWLTPCVPRAGIVRDVFKYWLSDQHPMAVHVLELCSQLPQGYAAAHSCLLPLVPEQEDRMVGAHVNVENISAAQQDLKQRLQQEVLHPLDQWLAAYRTIKVRRMPHVGL